MYSLQLANNRSHDTAAAANVGKAGRNCGISTDRQMTAKGQTRQFRAQAY